MWSIVCLCALATSTLASPNWKPNFEYEYDIQGRTLTSLHEVSNQYSGILFKANLKVQLSAEGILNARIPDSYYSQVHSHLENGWSTHFPESKISWKPLRLSSKPFQIAMEDGVIKGLIVSGDMDNWEINLIKGIVSQFQLKVTEKAQSEYKDSSFAEQGVLSTFTVMEDTVTGKTATFYRISTVPEYLVQTYPNAEFMIQEGKGKVFEITKNKNYSLSAQLPSYFYGFAALETGFPATNKMGSFFTRDSFSRAVVTGELNSYTIQNSHTVSEILVAPTLSDKQKGSVYSMLNITLKQMSENYQSIEDVSYPLHLDSLVYSNEAIQNAKLKMPTSMKFSRPSRYETAEDEKLNEEGLMMFYRGYNKITREEKRWINLKIRNVCKEIAEDSQNPYTMLVKDTMNKFSILKRLVKLLDATALKQIADELYEARQHLERDAWPIFRDSVAVCGSEPALHVIKEWIETSKIEDAEAAIVVSSMAKTVRQLSVDYLESFLELVKDQRVKSKWPLNDTSVLSFSHLVRQVFIDERHSSVQIPAKTLKKIRSPKGIEFLKQNVISFFSEKLHAAIAAAETHKIHVYIRCLGNIAHPHILFAFKPYLEGKKQASQYQRLLMVLAMDKLAEHYPEHTKVVLHRIYQNMGENPAVRAVAVYQIMRTSPSTELLQYMASYTHYDKHDVVIAAVKSAIESAAELKGSQFQQIRQAAEAAKPLLTKKTLGVQYGGSYLHEYFVEELKVHFRDSLLMIGSVDQYYPRGIKYSLQYNLGGIQNELVNFQTITSSIDDLIHVFKQQTENYSQQEDKQEQNYQQQSERQWSSQYIARLLKLEPEEREQLEGSFYFETGILQGMLSFDNTTIPNIRKQIKNWEQELDDGKQIQYVKLYSERDMKIAFPTEMGFVFVYSYETPTMVRLHGSIKATANPRISQEKLNQPDSIEITSDLTLTFTSKIQGRISFVTQFDHVEYASGFDKHAQIHLPIKGNFQWNLKTKKFRADVETKSSNDETRLLHYSTWPYTSRIDGTKFEQISLSPETKHIRQENLRSIDKTIGETYTGLAVRVQIEHERELIDIQHIRNLIFKHGMTVGLMSLWNEGQIQYSQINITHLVKESPTKKIVVDICSKAEYRADSNSVASLQNYEISSERFSQERLKNALYKVTPGIKNAKLESYDLSVEFQGNKVIKYVMTGAYAKSDIYPRSKIFVSARKESDMQNEQPYVVTFEANSIVGNTNGLNLEYAMENEPKMVSEMEIIFGPESRTASKIHAKLEFQRTDERKRYLRNQPNFKRCQYEMREGNYQLPTCNNVSTEFNLFDNINANIRYENITQQMKEALKSIYYATLYNYYLNTEIDSEKRSENPNEIKMQAAFDPDLRSVNISVKTSEVKTTLKNIPVKEIAKRVFVSHPVFHARSRLMALVLGSEIYRPSCVVDKTKISTFLQSIYPADISNKWTVMFQYMPKHASQGENKHYKLVRQTENYAILIRNNEEFQSNKKEVKITLSSPETQLRVVDITLSPTEQRSNNPSIKVTVDGKEIQIKEDKSFQYGQGYIQIYAIPNGEVKVEVRDQFYIIFDGQRMKVSLLNGKFRDATMGLCGQFSDQNEEFFSPAKCFARNHKKFIESYEIESYEGQQVRKEMGSKNNKVCTRKNFPVYVKVVGSNDEYVSEDCTKFQTQYVETDQEICFTLGQMPVCSKSCQPTSSAIRNVPVHCIKKTSVAQLWKQQIDNGGSPDFSHKSKTRKESLKIHQNCF